MQGIEHNINLIHFSNWLLICHCLCLRWKNTDVLPPSSSQPTVPHAPVCVFVCILWERLDSWILPALISFTGQCFWDVNSCLREDVKGKPWVESMAVEARIDTHAQWAVKVGGRERLGWWSVRGYMRLAIVHFVVIASQLSCQKSMGTKTLCKHGEVKASSA